MFEWEGDFRIISYNINVGYIIKPEHLFLLKRRKHEVSFKQ